MIHHWYFDNTKMISFWRTSVKTQHSQVWSRWNEKYRTSFARTVVIVDCWERNTHWKGIFINTYHPTTSRKQQRSWEKQQDTVMLTLWYDLPWILRWVFKSFTIEIIFCDIQKLCLRVLRLSKSVIIVSLRWGPER